MFDQYKISSSLQLRLLPNPIQFHSCCNQSEKPDLCYDFLPIFFFSAISLLDELLQKFIISLFFRGKRKILVLTHTLATGWIERHLYHVDGLHQSSTPLHHHLRAPLLTLPEQF